MTLTVFLKDEVLARGTPEEVAPAMRELQPLERAEDLLAFDEASDLAGSSARAAFTKAINVTTSATAMRRNMVSPVGVQRGRMRLGRRWFN